MKQIIFQGYGDDTFACHGNGINVDWDNCSGGDPIWMRVQSGDDALLVSGQYAPGPAEGWLIGVSPAGCPAGDERHIPKWPITFGRGQRAYSPHLIIAVPDDVVVTLVDDKGRKKPTTPIENEGLISSLRTENDALQGQLRDARRLADQLTRMLGRQAMYRG